jgi:Cu(I)/Ag(I) efflux system protein CusF
MRHANSLWVIMSVFTFSGVGCAQAAEMNMKDMPVENMQGMAMQNRPAVTTHKTEGIVKRIDVGNARVTLEHEAVTSLNWPPMTMSFGLADRSLLSNIKAGMKVKIEFKEEGKGKYVITKLQG